MKETTQTNKAKIKVIKSGSKKTKAKLPQYKSSNRLVRGKKRSFLKCAIMNFPPAESKNVPSTSSSAHSLDDTHLLPQRSINQKKKKSCSTIKGFNIETQYSMGVSFEAINDTTEASLAKNKYHKQYHNNNNLKQQRNLGSPVIVETLSESLSLLQIPQILRQNQKTKTENNACDYNLSHIQSISSQKDEACIIVAKSVNPQNTSCSTGNETRRSLPLRNNRKQQKDAVHDTSSSKNNTIADDSDYSWNSNETTPTFEKYLENMIVGIMDTDKSVLRETIPGPATIKKNMNSIHDDECQPRFYCLRNKVVVIMPAKTRFSFIGKIVAKVLYGAIEVYGCVMTTETEATKIYSARGYSSVSIETSEKVLGDNEPNIWASLEVEGINRNKKNKLVIDIDNIRPGMVVILLANLENTLTKFLGIFYPFRLFPKIKNLSHQSWTNTKRAEVILQSHLFVDRCASKELTIDQCMVQDVSEKMLNSWHANEWSCTLIAGGKSVGKSTTVRFLINKLLPVSKKVVLIDVDPGQPECTPSGCLSISVIENPLMGPNFTHLNTPLFQLYIDEINVTCCIARYIEALKMLIDKVSSCPALSCLPIVVNTMGFVRNIGWDIIILTIKLMRPFLVVQILSEKPKNNYPEYLSKQVVNRQELPWSSWSINIAVDCSQPCNHELRVIRSHAEHRNTPGPEFWNMEPHQQRELSLVSYLSKIVQRPTNVTLYDDDISFSINAAVPYVTLFSSLSILIPKSFAPQSHALNVINGNIVALCGIDREVDDESQDVQDTSSPRVLDRSSPCVCYGFGLVRGVDTERKEIYINTPLSISMMRQVNCLAGCIPVPPKLLKLNQKPNVPYTGGSDVLPTSREPRRGYFRMGHKLVGSSS